jgi:hypothetical protein
MTIPANWRKSSASANGGDCVEVRNDLGAVRDTKNPDKVMALPRQAVAALVRSVR